jgi:hypothetical protein
VNSRRTSVNSHRMEVNSRRTSMNSHMKGGEFTQEGR